MARVGTVALLGLILLIGWTVIVQPHMQAVPTLPEPAVIGQVEEAAANVRAAAEVIPSAVDLVLDPDVTVIGVWCGEAIPQTFEPPGLGERVSWRLHARISHADVLNAIATEAMAGRCVPYTCGMWRIRAHLFCIAGMPFGGTGWIPLNWNTATAMYETGTAYLIRQKRMNQVIEEEHCVPAVPGW